MLDNDTCLQLRPTRGVELRNCFSRGRHVNDHNNLTIHRNAGTQDVTSFDKLSVGISWSRQLHKFYRRGLGLLNGHGIRSIGGG